MFLLGLLLGFCLCPVVVILYGIVDHWRHPFHLMQYHHAHERAVVARAAEAQGVHLRQYP